MSVIPLYLLQFEEIKCRQTNLTYIIHFNLTTYFDSMCASSGNNIKFIKVMYTIVIKGNNNNNNGYYNFTCNPTHVNVSIFLLK
jgi:hypothetical protein